MTGKQKYDLFTVDWSDLEIAFRDGSTGIDSFLDLQRAEVVVLLDDDDEERASVLRHPERFVAIPQLSRDSALQILQDFVGQLGPSPQRQRLLQALKSPSPYMDATSVLTSTEVLRRRYELFEERAVLKHIRLWLESLGTQASTSRSILQKNQAA